MSSIDALRDLPDAVIRNEAAWRAWYDLEALERSPMPNYEGQLASFERMCVVKVGQMMQRRDSGGSVHAAPFILLQTRECAEFVMQAFREDRTLVAASDLIADSLGQKFVDGVPLSIDRVWEESEPLRPIICLLSPGMQIVG